MAEASATPASTRPRVSPHGAALMLVLLLALDLRLESVLYSIVDRPVRADASEYVLYAHNLQRFGVYSRSDTLSPDPEPPVPPVPDSTRVPLYPLFLTLFLDQPPTTDNLRSILLAQALLGTLTVLLAYFLGRMLLPPSLALAAALLTALSPHLVTMSIYLLSETLLTLVAVLGVLAAATVLRQGKPAATLAVGGLLALAALAHPMLQYFVVGLCGYVLLAPAPAPRLRTAAVLFLGFALVYGAWVGRNLATLGSAGDPTLMLAALRAGAYTDLMYQERPETFGYPYRADPAYPESVQSLSATMDAIGKSFAQRPIEQLRWYLLGKPAMLYSWDNIADQGDVYIYPTVSSPYIYLPVFRFTHGLMHATHGLWVLLMACGAALVWLPLRLTQLSPAAAHAARVVSLLLLYHLAVMVAGFPIPRYSIALRPFLYILAMLPLALVVQRLWRRDTHAG